MLNSGDALVSQISKMAFNIAARGFLDAGSKEIRKIKVVAINQRFQKSALPGEKFRIG